jgi:ubiquinone/menaquinone biosynthesis C-methylase UbiE
MSVAAAGRLGSTDVARLDPYQFMAVIGKRVIHPGGRHSSETLFRVAEFTAEHRVLDVGCGVGTSAIQIAHRFGSKVTAVDISPLMLQRAEANVRAARVGDRVAVERGDILALGYADATFDRVIAEAVTMFVDRPRAAAELVRVCAPGGRVLATEFFWRKPPTAEAREIFLGQVCPGMEIDTLEDWVQIYQEAGLSNIQVESGPFEMMTPRGFLSDEGFAHSMAIMGRVMSRLVYMRKMAWLMPRIQRAVPYLGYIAVCGTKPPATSS